MRTVAHVSEIPLAMPSLRVFADRITDVHPDAIHIATEGPIGHVARHHCVRVGYAFQQAFLRDFPIHICAAASPPQAFGVELASLVPLPRAVMTGTPAFVEPLRKRVFRNVMLRSPGVDFELFRPRQEYPYLVLDRYYYMSGELQLTKTSMHSYLCNYRFPLLPLVCSSSAKAYRQFPNLIFS